MRGLDAIPYQWAAAAYSGAIDSGKTLCGFLFGSTAFLGFHCGEGETAAPAVEDEKRTRAIEAANQLFTGFIKEFGTTECRSLTNCNFSKKEEVDAFMKNEVYKHTCFKQFEYVLRYCLDHMGKQPSA